MKQTISETVDRVARRRDSAKSQKTHGHQEEQSLVWDE